jgi:hypothetical protein
MNSERGVLRSTRPALRRRWGRLSLAVTTGAARDEGLGSSHTDAATATWKRYIQAGRMEAALAIAVFATMCFMVLSVTPQSAEPYDGAYRASIVAISQGHFLTLSTAQAEKLASELNDNPAAPPNQWVEVTPGRWISEKDPGYPFLAALFDKLGLIRWAALFYGALACVGLFLGGRRWLGSFGGLAAVGLYCSSGAALAFAWRDFMPTFTDASLIAAGVGALLWVVLATDASVRRRTWVGLAGFVALELATFVRYTDIAILACATAAMIAAWWSGAPNLQRRSLWVWLASVIVFCVALATFNDIVYGGPLKSGYPPGEITFDLGAIGPNLRLMPAHLLQATPVMVLGLSAFIWILVRRLAVRRAPSQPIQNVRRDLWIGTTLAGCWLTIWALYSAYTWTTDPTNAAISDVRFYVPAIGLIAMLGAWLVTRIDRIAWRAGATLAAVVALFALGVSSFHVMYTALGIHLHG